MKQLKKTLLSLMCVCMLFGFAACGTDNRNDKDTTNKTEDADNKKDDGVLEDVGRGIDNGVRDVVDGAEDVLDGDADNNNDVNRNGNVNDKKTR